MNRILNFKLAFLALNFSILCHIFVIFLLLEKNNKEKKYAVVDLSNYSKFQTFNLKSNEKIEKKDSLDKKKNTKKINKNLELKEQNPKKLTIQKELTYPKVEMLKEREKKKTLLQKKSQFEETKTKDEQKNQEKILNNINSPQKQSTASKNLLILKNKALYNYLKLISTQINVLANKSYPKRSIMRREQGKILTRLTIDISGNVTDLNILTKSPKNLANSAEKILKKMQTLPSPPKILMKDSKFIVVEIPINYILK